jgi:hypothetical protein
MAFTQQLNRGCASQNPDNQLGKKTDMEISASERQRRGGFWLIFDAVHLQLCTFSPLFCFLAADGPIP